MQTVAKQCCSWVTQGKLRTEGKFNVAYAAPKVLHEQQIESTTL